MIQNNTYSEVSTNGQNALELASRGYNVFPCHSILENDMCSCNNENCSSPGKHPIPHNGLKSATTNKRKIRRWWAQNPNANIAIATGETSGFFALDIDPKNGGDTSFSNLLETHEALPPTKTCKTGGEGRHYYFKMPEGHEIKNSANQLAPGIDIRGTGGYIIAPPSNHISGGNYEWHNDYDLCEAPEWLLKKIKEPKTSITNKHSKPKTGTVDFSDQPKADVEQIINECSWMSHCKNNAESLSETDWYYALSIIGRCENGNELAHMLSEPHPKYSPKETEDKLHHALEAAGPVKCQTVRSKLGAEKHCTNCIYFENITSPIQLGTARHPLIDRFYYITTLKRFYDKNTGHMYDKEGFNAAYSHKNKNKSGLGTQFLSSPLLKKVTTFTYNPQKPKLVKEGAQFKLNVWQPSNIIAEEGDVTIFTKHLKYMFPDDKERKMVLDFLAYTIQHEGDKIHYALLIIGNQGTGKSYFGEIMSKLLNSNNVSQIETEELSSEFNSWLANKSLVVIEELMAANRLKTANKLKPILTQHTIRVNEKYLPAYEIDNSANFLIFTNHEKPIILEATDRRYCVINSPANAQKPEYYDTLWEWSYDNLGAILHYLQNHDLTNFEPKANAPMTEAKKRLIEETEEEWVKDLRAMIENGTGLFSSDIFSLNDLKEHPHINIPRIIANNPNKLAQLIESFGGMNLGPIRIDDKGNKKRLWAIRNCNKWLASSEAEIAIEYNNRNLIR